MTAKLTPKSVERLNNQEQTQADGLALFDTVLNQWQSNVSALERRIQTAVDKKRDSGTPQYQQPIDSDEIDNAVFDILPHLKEGDS